jgi:serine/threonine-protein kinase HipA
VDRTPRVRRAPGRARALFQRAGQVPADPSGEMGRRSHNRALGVWANGLRVGRWLVPARGASEFSYDESWVESAYGRPISLSLPMTFDAIPVKSQRVDFYFDNLLPDSAAIRQRIRNRFQTKSDDAIDLLASIGRDCVGALQLLPDEETPNSGTTIDATPLSEMEVERELLRNIAPSSFDDASEFRISLAGAQEKTGFTLHRGRWCRPRGATPTTHIFKLPLGLVGGNQFDMRASLENEWLCSRLLEAYGVPVASSNVEVFGNTKVLAVERFDRALHSSKKYWLRLVQEDFCQALGRPSSQKYEADGGPGLVELARVLQRSVARQDDLTTLLRATLLFWMLAATDGHGKNFSIQILPQGRYQLTPLYDVISAWPIIGDLANQLHLKKLKLAMALRGKNAHYRWTEFNRQRFNAAAEQCGLGSNMEGIIADVCERTPKVIDEVEAQLPAEFPRSVFNAVTQGLSRSANSLERMR